jgi:hypothetical protein
MVVNEAMLYQIILELMESRAYEAEYINKGGIAFKSYAMALEDVWLRVIGSPLDFSTSSTSSTSSTPSTPVGKPF